MRAGSHLGAAQMACAPDCRTVTLLSALGEMSGTREGNGTQFEISGEPTMLVTSWMQDAVRFRLVN